MIHGTYLELYAKFKNEMLSFEKMKLVVVLYKEKIKKDEM